MPYVGGVWVFEGYCDVHEGGICVTFKTYVGVCAKKNFSGLYRIVVEDPAVSTMGIKVSYYGLGERGIGESVYDKVFWISEEEYFPV